MAYIRARYERHEDRFGRLVVVAERGAFKGEGSAWFAEDRLLEFARQLTGLQPSDTESIEIEGGHVLFDGVNDVHVGLRFRPVGTLRTLVCELRLATPSPDHGQDPYHREPFALLTLEMWSDYAALDEFAGTLIALVGGRADEAVFEASDF